MDGIILDVDGTLWDYTDSAAEAWNQAIRENSDLNLHITGAKLKKLFGKTMDEIYSELLPELPREEQYRLGKLCYEYEDRMLAATPGIPYDKVPETIHLLSQKIDFFIVSNCQCGYIENFMKATGLTPYIKDHLCFGETQVSKGQTILQLMKRNKLESPVYVGDTIGDYNACKEAGIPFIFAEYGFGSVPQAEKKISRFEDIQQVLGL